MENTIYINESLRSTWMGLLQLMMKKMHREVKQTKVASATVQTSRDLWTIPRPQENSSICSSYTVELWEINNVFYRKECVDSSL